MPSDLGLAIIAEDRLSGSVAERLVAAAKPGLRTALPPVYAGGIEKIRAQMPKYLNASHVVPHLVLVDLDKTACAPALLTAWRLPVTGARLLFRVAVRETEAWVLADRKGFADFAGIPVSKVPQFPELERDPKQTLINLVRRSSRKRMVAEMVPAPGSRVSIGPLYNELLCEFVQTRWNPEAACCNAPSVAKALVRLRSFL